MKSTIFLLSVRVKQSVGAVNSHLHNKLEQLKNFFISGEFPKNVRLRQETKKTHLHNNLERSVFGFGLKVPPPIFFHSEYFFLLFL